MEMVMINSSDLPIKSTANAKNILEAYAEKNVIIQFRKENNDIAQITPCIDGTFEIIECAEDSNEFTRIALRDDIDGTAKRLYQLRKYFNQKFSE